MMFKRERGKKYENVVKRYTDQIVRFQYMFKISLEKIKWKVVYEKIIVKMFLEFKKDMNF